MGRDTEPIWLMGVGASAGGLEALQDMLRGFPEGLPLSIIIAQHLAPNYKSLLAELLGRDTSWQVTVASDEAVPEPGVVHVCPPNTDIVVQEGRIRLLAPISGAGPKPSADALLTSLAAEADLRSIGVVLSGTGSDGSYGMREIHAAGGLTIAQDPATAKYASMPRSAIDAGMVDRTASAGDIGRVVALHLSGQLGSAEEALVLPQSMLRRILSALHSQTGIDYSAYKESTLQRQISRRMAALQITDQPDYLSCLLGDAEEAKTLSRNMLVSVTSFYRDPEVWEAFSQEIDKRFTAGAAGVRAWVAGCATGEEAYTLAMVVARALGHPPDLADRLKVFATDLDEQALEFGRRGIYPAAAAARLPADLSSRYITGRGTEVSVSGRLKECVVFARHNMAADPPFSRMDIVSCRNVLIYFDTSLQESTLESLHYALNKDGLLLLGSSEGIGRKTELFRTVRAKMRIFAASVRIGGPDSPPHRPLPAIGAAATTRRVGRRADEQQALRDVLLRDLVSPSVVINEAGMVAHVLGDVTRYCRYPEGFPDPSLAAVLRPYLTTEVRRLLAMCQSSGESVLGDWLDPGDDGPRVRAKVSLSDSGLGRFTVVSFLDGVPAGSPGSGAEEDPVDLRRELQTTREALQSTIEELETSNEELQSVNEEMMASTEELQASNEELETINEELQASNEELGTLNEELQIRSKELADANLDLRNIQEAIAQALVIVDRKRRVVRFSTLAVRLFALVPDDIGAPVESIATTVEVPGLAAAIDQVVASGVPEMLQAGSTHYDYQIQISAWRDQSQDIGGAVLSITDVTGTRAGRMAALNAAADLKLITDGLGAAVWARRVDDGALLRVGPDVSDLLGVPVHELLADGGAWTRNVVAEDAQNAALAAAPDRPERLRYRVRHGGRVRVLLDITHGKSVLEGDTLLGTLRDISEGVRQHADSEADRMVVESLFGPGEQLALLLDSAKRIARAGVGSEAFLGLPSTVLVGRELPDLCVAEDREVLRAWWVGLIDATMPAPVTVDFMRRDGSKRSMRILAQPLPNGRWLVLMNDVTDQQVLVQQLRSNTNRDPLTGLMSRSAFEAALADALGRANRASSRMALMWLDLDGFKDINDRLGHHTGDAVLAAMGARLLSMRRSGDQVGRVGGDEFCVIIEDFKTIERIDLAANRILDTLRDPMGDQDGVRVCGSMGIAVFPSDGTDPAALMRAADSAMYSAKRQGGDRYHYFQPEMHEKSEERARQRAEIAESLRESAFVLHYQPIVPVGGGLWGVEALVRRVDREGRLHPAAEFIELAETSGQIRHIGRLVLQLLVQDIERRLPPDVLVAVNLSPTELADPAFLNEVRQSGIVKYLPRVIVEVTERSAVQRTGPGAAAIDMLRSMGARVAVDDYGTGYSNIRALAQLEPSIIKVDQELLAMAGRGDRRGEAFLEAAVSIAEALGAQVVAEGVEELHQLQILERIGIPLAQGYLLGRPMSAADLARESGG